MKRVWKCDFCSHTHKLDSEVKEHEIKCSSNPIHKKCWSCEHHGDIGEYGSSYTICELEKNGISIYSVVDGEYDGNCDGWQSDDPQLMRKLKLEKIKNYE